MFLEIKLTSSEILRATNADRGDVVKTCVYDRLAKRSTTVERAGGAALQGGHASSVMLQDVDGSIGCV